MPVKTVGPLDDTALAVMALSGVRELRQSTIAPTTGAQAAYTVVDVNCRRVMVFHLGAGTPGAGDIRVRCNATAASTHMPLVPQTYAVFYLQAGETLSCWNTSADTITVNVLEME